jgi:hypothetical protein
LASHGNELDSAIAAAQSGKEISLQGITRPGDFQTAMSDNLKGPFLFYSSLSLSLSLFCVYTLNLF